MIIQRHKRNARELKHCNRNEDTSDKLINRLDQVKERICTGGYLNSNPLTAGNKQQKD